MAAGRAITCRKRATRSSSRRNQSAWEETDWHKILALYQLLVAIDPSPVVLLDRAIALRYVVDAATALREVDALTDSLDRYHLFHATRAELLRAVGRGAEARAADQRALELTENPAERSLIGARLA